MRSHDDYTVGWVCALPLEMTAAITMLDETHPQLPYPETDHNAYALGSIAGHGVVIACLPSGIYGTVSAATVVAQMVSTFPQIKFGMMVGIGGGVPSESNDIRLGDVVVSRPTGVYSGVVQYDLGKALQGGGFQQTGSLNHPPQLLLTHMSLLQATMVDSEDERIYSLVQTVLNRHPQLNEDFGCPGPDKDILFKSEYPHRSDVGSDGACMHCDPRHAVLRNARISMEPHVHYGLIASGDKVIKDSETRDRLAQELGVICFEMEAAGLMNQIPCLVVRGICDYSDSHKNKNWQGYAALTAAAYSKVLLSTLKPRTVNHIRSLNKGEITAEKKACLASLFLSDPEEDKNALKRRRGDRAPDTCRWILDTNALQKWLGFDNGVPRSSLGFIKGHADVRSNIFWLYGNPGTGKSTIVVTMAEELPKKPYFDNAKTLAYFFCDSSSANRRTAVSILRGLLYQLVKERPELIELLYSKYMERKDALFTSFDALWSVLMSIGTDAASGDKYCIIDAIDECEPESQEMLLAQINQTFRNPASENHLGLHILLTSRPYPEIGRYLSHFNHQNLSQYPQVATDLNLLIRSKVAELSERNGYSKKVAAEVSETLEDKAEGTFLWVGIACTELASVRSRDAVKTLRKMPRGLDSLYRNLLDTALTHSGEDNHMLLQMMSVVAIAQQPLSVAELSVACNLYPNEDEESRLIFTCEDIELCRLMVVVQSGVVRLLHKSVKDFLLRKGEDNQHLVDDAKAHAALAYRCLDIWMKNYEALSMNEPWKPLVDIEFLLYAGKYWGVHAHYASSEFHVLRQHEKFFRAKSSERDIWVRELEYPLNLPNDPEGFSVLHVAALFGINALVDFAFEEMRHERVHGRELKYQPRYEDSRFADSRDRTPLQVAAETGHIEVMSLLLDRKAEHVEIAAEVAEAAATNEDCGEQMVALLLDHKVQIDESVFIAAASNRSRGGAIMSMLLDQAWGMPVTREMGIWAAPETIYARLRKLLTLAPHLSAPQISEEVIRAAVKNRESGTAIMTDLLNRLGPGMRLSDGIVEDMCANLEPSVVQLFLNQNAERIPLTKDLILAALRNSTEADKVLSILFDMCYAQGMSSQDIMVDICGRVSPRVINQFFDGQRAQLVLTGASVMTASFNKQGEEVMSVMLDRCQIRDLDDVVLATCTRFGPNVVRKLLDKFNPVRLSTKIIRAIAGKENNAKSVMMTILLLPQLSRPGEQEISLICQTFDTDVVHVLFDHQKNIHATYDLVASIHMNGERKEIMTALLEQFGGSSMTLGLVNMICKLFDSKIVELLLRKQNGLKVTADLINAISLNKQYGKDVMSAIIHQAGLTPIKPELVAMICRLFDADVVDQLPEIAFSKSLVYAAAQNFLYSKEVMRVLLRKYDHNIQLDHETIAAIFDIFAGDLEMIALLHSHISISSRIFTEDDLVKMFEAVSPDTDIAYTHSNAVTIAMMLDKYGNPQPAEEAIQLAASNEVDARNVMLLLLHSFQGHVQLSEAMFVAAAANEYQGSDVMEVLLDWEGNGLLVSERVLKTAAMNHRKGRDLMHLLLCRCRQRFLNVEVVKTALANHQSGREIIKLLLEHCAGTTLQITPDLARVAAAANGKDVFTMLLSSEQILVRVQQEAVVTVCQLFDLELVSLLLSTHGSQVVITDDVVSAAATNCLHAKDVLGLLLSKRQMTVPTFERALEAAAYADEKEAMAFLLQHQDRKEGAISEDIVCAAAGNRWGTSETLSLLLDRYAFDFPITERVLIAAARNGRGDTLSLLLGQGDEILVTDAVWHAASANEYHSKRVLDLLQRYPFGRHASLKQT
ncbi:uncharacterized protein DSM5745_02480 [Aspergillus mulundensis]|uniref:NACHT domain-containing protein n=1 Tax=Aspergillus mulundensis TaxID=1810919 RepID=A0A3D8SWM4_9EURO|nr:hypothetical protein DSM5745_02480 [Aspergillus mulundensis]RDW90705.1 hypothetical protein DSM5745_02480 [Aspergillus mulundensis]